jgi:hypothetical protein
MTFGLHASGEHFRPAEPDPCRGRNMHVGLTAGAVNLRTIYLVEHPANLSHVQVGTLTGCTSTSGCQGDAIVGDDPMFDAATGAEVGRIMFECFLVDPGSGLFHCPGITIELDGRGQVVFSEKFDGSRQTSPITGGTGEFLGVTGTVTDFLPSNGNGDFVFTITK